MKPLQQHLTHGKNSGTLAIILSVRVCVLIPGVFSMLFQRIKTLVELLYQQLLRLCFLRKIFFREPLMT